MRDEHGAGIEAVIYVAGRTFVGPALVPNSTYLQLIVEGARERRLPEEYRIEIEAALVPQDETNTLLTEMAAASRLSKRHTIVYHPKLSFESC